ncbi:MAG: M42 family metallopeptidase [Burkholderiales bacterium]|nr:M42 family metallopeptidase [Anaerolineae bacterium]
MSLNIDSQSTATTAFLVGLLNTPSPTGYHVEAIAYTQAAFADLSVPGLELSLTKKGALVATWAGKSSDTPRGVTAHLDTLGLMVKEIKDNGRLKCTALGGGHWNAVEFEGVTIRTYSDKRYRGTVVLQNTSQHVNGDFEKIERKSDNMEVRIDAKTKSADETRALGIEIGDFVFLDPRVEVTDTGFIRSRHLDDKAAVANVYGALLALKDAGLQPAQTTTFLIANYEEVGHGGSAGLPIVLDELLTIDMGAVSEGQNSDEFSVSICAKDSSGPYHFDMNTKLRRIGDAFNIPYRMDIYPHYSSDGSAYWLAGGDARVGLIGPGIDASHGYERTHQESLDHTTHMLARYLLEE